MRTEARQKTGNARPRWGRVLVFCALFACVFAAVQHVLTYKHSLEQYWPQRFATYAALPRDTLDVVVVGSSMGDHAVSPNILWREAGIASYNLSGSMHQHLFTEQKLLTMLELNTAPKYVILTPSTLFDGTVHNTETWAAYRKLVSALPTLAQRVRAVRALGDDREACGLERDTLSFVIPLLYSHARWPQIKPWEIPPASAFADRDPAFMLGQSYVPDVKDITARLAQQLDSGKTELDPVAMACCERILEICRQNGITPIVLLLPPLDGSPSDAQRKTVKAYFAQHGALVWDYMSDEEMARMAWDFTRDFGDWTHLNARGAARLTLDVAARLAQLPGIEDHRGDERYAVWEEYSQMFYDLYGAQVEEVKQEILAAE